MELSMPNVIAQRETIVIPTYPEAPCEELPMFAENRVHQRSSGNPYPNKVVIKTREKEKVDRSYEAIRLENEYLELIILPELGGRIFSAKDKRTGYDFFYQQHVIKPALIGALGSWISGGVEFNWPYHHRPSTFMPVDSEIVRDGAGYTVWLSEHDPIDRMKGMVGIHLEPGKAYFETRMKLSNRTPMRRSFLWWENTAVPVNPDYEIFFPPDVDYVNFHYRRSHTTYPIAHGMFNGFRYDDGGVDIRKHFNTKYSTSYFSADSDYDFFGGYDNGKQCGVVHISDHHTSTGKKMFTWAYNQLSRSWERALTDSDGAYAELMAGSYSNNQPDFSWLEAYETKNFSQYWFPISRIGVPTYATLKGAVHVSDGCVKLQTTEKIKNAKLTLTVGTKTLLSKKVTLEPGEVAAFEIPECDLSEYIISVEDVLCYQKKNREKNPLPPFFPEVPMPNEETSAYQCWLSGIHLMQFRDPNADPRKYFERAIDLDPEFAPGYETLGECAINDGNFELAEELLTKAVDKMNRLNTEHQSGRAYYLLGLAKRYLGKDHEAEHYFRKAAWSDDFVSAGMTEAARIGAKHGDYANGLFCAETALTRNAENCVAGPIAALCQYRLGEKAAARRRVEGILTVDPLNHLARYVAVMIGMSNEKDFFSKLSSDPSQTCLDLAVDLKTCGFEAEAKELLSDLVTYRTTAVAPTVAYWIGKPELADPKHRTFPFRPEERELLREQKDDFAKYLLGCLEFAHRRYEDAFLLWKDLPGYDAARCRAVYYWKVGRHDDALRDLDRAISLAPDCDQLIYEKAYLLNHISYDAKRTEEIIGCYVKDVATARDDVCTEWAAAAIRAGDYEKALWILNNHTFIPCEGGETIVAKQHINAHLGLGVRYYQEGEWSRALDEVRTAQTIPENLGAGLWHVDPLVPSQYREAMCLIKLGRPDDAAKIFSYIEGIYVDFFSNMHLPELPVYQALSKIRLGRPEEGIALARSFRAECERNKARTDSGYFSTTPFFISYLDDAREMRDAYYNRMIDFCDTVINGTTELL